MELQWPLILFTTFVAWSAGLFATQSILALKMQAKQAQLPALITSFVVLVIGGIAVFFHLEHWERIFNGFGHITSGITQELICVVLMAVAMVAYFVVLRKGNGEGVVSKPIAIAGIVTALLLIVISGASYLMAARPAWDSPSEVLSVLGGACVLGPATMAVIMGICAKDEPVKETMLPVILVIGALVNALTTVAYLLVISASAESVIDFSYYVDHSYIVMPMVSAAAANPFAGSACVMSVVAIAASVVAAVLALVDKGKTMPVSAAIVVVALAGVIALRMVFYTVGVSFFMLF